VALTATSRYGQSIYSETVQVEAACVPVSGADFSFTPSSPKGGETVTFTGTVMTGTLPITYTWSFGDGGTGAGAVIPHAFPLTATAQSYTVTLTTINACPSQAVMSKSVTVWPLTLYLPMVVR
jgi:PKD repeat protein